VNIQNFTAESGVSYYTELSFVFFSILSFCFFTILYASATANIQVAKNVKNPIIMAIRQKLNPNKANNANSLYSHLHRPGRVLELLKIITLQSQDFFSCF